MPLIVAIGGSRNFQPWGLVWNYVMALHAKYPDFCLVSGGARGVDRDAASAAVVSGHEVLVYRPTPKATPAPKESGHRGDFYRIETWHYNCEYHEPSKRLIGLQVEELPDLYPTWRDAALSRNTYMVMKVPIGGPVVAFWDGTSTGTAYLIREAKRLGRHLCVYYGDGRHEEYPARP